MKTASEYWEQRFGKNPESDSEKLAVAFAAEYANYIKEQKVIQLQNLYFDLSGKELT